MPVLATPPFTQLIICSSLIPSSFKSICPFLALHSSSYPYLLRLWSPHVLSKVLERNSAMTYLSLRIENDDGSTRTGTVKLDGPGGKIKVGVGDPSLGRSSIWVIHGPRHTADLYVGNRDIMGFQKVSLHESGVWRFAWTAERADLVLPPGSDRVLDRWLAPVEFGAGWSIAFRIIIPEEDTYTIAPVGGNRKSRSAIHWLPRPEPGKIVVLHVIVAEPDQGEVLLKHAMPIDLFFSVKGDGRQQVCLLIASYVEPEAEQREWQRRTRDELIGRVMTDYPGVLTPTTRIAVFGNQDDGTRLFLDLGIPPGWAHPK